MAVAKKHAQIAVWTPRSLSFWFFGIAVQQASCWFCWFCWF